MKVHFIGIGGFGMSGLAEYLLSKGNSVSGSDMMKTDLTLRLEKSGARIYYFHSGKNISSDTQLVVYSSAVKQDNPEYIFAINNNIEIIKRAEMLGRIANESFLISISGTHGKTSTSAMTSFILIDNGLDPDVFVGGAMGFLDGSTSHIGSGKYCVVEADEYDRSFLTLKSDIAVVNNIDMDHQDIYGNIDEIKENFTSFLKNNKNKSIIIANGDDKNVKDVIKIFGNKVLTFGTDKSNDYIIENVTDYSGADITTKFNIASKNQTVTDICLRTPGLHNVFNATAAFIISSSLNITDEEYKKSIAEFTGVKRRLELKYSSKIKIYDDYAHHPVEVKSSYDALRRITKGRLITVFQPHLYSRTAEFFKEFAVSLKDNDIIILTDIYPARERPIEGITSDLIFEELMNISRNKLYILKKDDIISFLNEETDTGDTIVFQGAGDITNICDKFISQIKEKKND